MAKGKIFKTDFGELWAFALPLLIEQTSVQLMPFVSSFISRGMGTQAVSGVNLVESINLFASNIFIAISVGTTVVVSQYRGKRDPEAAGKAAFQAMKVSCYIALLTSISLLTFLNPAMNAFFGSNVEADLYYYARVYFISSLISYPFYSIYSTSAATLRGSGQSRASLIGTVVMNISYIISGLTLVNGFDMGIWGTGCALIFSRAAGMTAMLIMLPRSSRESIIFPKFSFALDMEALGPLVRVGLPICIEQVLFSGGKLITQRFAVGMSSQQLSVNSIGNIFTGLFNIPGITLNNVSIALVGRRIGAKDDQGAKDLLDDMLKLSFVVLTVYLLIWLPLMNPFFGLYTDDPFIISTLWKILLVTVIISPTIWVRSFLLSNGMKGAGDTRFTTIIAITSMFAFRVFFAYIFGVMLDYGVTGIWIGMFLDWIFRCIVFSIRFKSGKWLGKGI